MKKRWLLKKKKKINPYAKAALIAAGVGGAAGIGGAAGAGVGAVNAQKYMTKLKQKNWSNLFADADKIRNSIIIRDAKKGAKRSAAIAAVALPAAVGINKLINRNKDK
jgi:hypothetical protein